MVNKQDGSIDLAQSVLLSPRLTYKELEKANFYPKERYVWKRFHLFSNLKNTFLWPCSAWQRKIDTTYSLGYNFWVSHYVSIPARPNSRKKMPEDIILDPSITPSLKGKFFQPGHIRIGMTLFFCKSLLKEVRFWFGDKNVQSRADISKYEPDYGKASDDFYNKLLETDLGKAHIQALSHHDYIQKSYTFSWGKVEWQYDSKGGGEEIVIKYE